MSGFAGILNLDNQPVDRARLARMMGLLSCLGPDGQDAWCDGPAVLGHTLLRTATEAWGRRQPRSLDGLVWIAADARIDAQAELKASLEAAGRRGISGASDAELVLHAYHAWGDECLSRLLGDFTFAIWDAPRRRLFCARDHFGVRPFYYARAGGALVFANALERIRLHDAVSACLDEREIADFLVFGFNQRPDTTTFADVSSLAPGHCLVCEGGEVRTRRYWTLPVERVRFRRPEEYAERFVELLGEAVGDRLRGASRAAILMSGGLDSTSIAAVAKGSSRSPAEAGCHGQSESSSRALAGVGQGSSLAARTLRAYTVVYERLIRHDEGRLARLVGAHLGIPVELVPVDGYRLYERWDEPGLRTPEPQDNPLWAMPVDLSRRIAADGCRVALSGEAGDALFAPAQTLPELAATGRLAPLARDIWRYWRAHGRRPPFGVGTWWRRRVEGAGRKAGGGRRRAGDVASACPPWLDAGFAERTRVRELVEELDAGDGSAYDELKSPMWPWCALVQSPAWTGADVEARYPFLDLRLVSFVLSVPSVPWVHDKELLRAAMRARPDRVSRRGAGGLRAPAEQQERRSSWPTLPDEVLAREKSPLSEDPVRALFRRDGPPPMPDPTSPVWEFVDRARFEQALHADPAGEGWRRDVTRVISLDRWMRTVDSRPSSVRIGSPSSSPSLSRSGE